MTGVRAAGIVAGLAVALSAVPAATAAPGTLRTGFNDAFLDGRSDRDAWLLRGRELGGSDLRILSAWAATAPRRPPTVAAATDPEWSGYRFADLDARVRQATAAGLSPLVMLYGAPPWAEGVGRPAKAPVGSWKPSSTAFGRFARAVAARYDGTHADPQRPGALLPRVTQFQVWNEPNLAVYLSPQWVDGRPASPRSYRALLNAAWRGIKAVRPDATVVAAGNSPFGDPAVGGARLRPVPFWRGVLCLNAELRRTCTTRTKADAIAHHPYPTAGPPSQPANSRNDISIADLGKLTAMIRAARRHHTLGPRRPALWVTEFAVRSNPPAPAGAYAVHSLPGQASYLAETQWRAWRAGASRFLFFNLLDAGSGSSPTGGEGLYFSDGRPKPAVRAAEFAVYARRSGPARLSVWIRPPASGPLTIETRRGGRWSAATTATAAADHPLTVQIPSRDVTAVRAVVGARTSYAWRVPRG